MVLAVAKSFPTLILEYLGSQEAGLLPKQESTLLVILFQRYISPKDIERNFESLSEKNIRWLTSSQIEYLIKNLEIDTEVQLKNFALISVSKVIALNNQSFRWKFLDIYLKFLFNAAESHKIKFFSASQMLNLQEALKALSFRQWINLKNNYTVDFEKQIELANFRTFPQSLIQAFSLSHVKLYLLAYVKYFECGNTLTEKDWQNLRECFVKIDQCEEFETKGFQFFISLLDASYLSNFKNQDFYYLTPLEADYFYEIRKKLVRSENCIQHLAQLALIASKFTFQDFCKEHVLVFLNSIALLNRAQADIFCQELENHMELYPKIKSDRNIYKSLGDACLKTKESFARLISKYCLTLFDEELLEKFSKKQAKQVLKWLSLVDPLDDEEMKKKLFLYEKL